MQEYEVDKIKQLLDSHVDIRERLDFIVYDRLTRLEHDNLAMHCINQELSERVARIEQIIKDKKEII